MRLLRWPPDGADALLLVCAFPTGRWRRAAPLCPCARGGLAAARDARVVLRLDIHEELTASALLVPSDRWDWYGRHRGQQGRHGAVAPAGGILVVGGAVPRRVAVDYGALLVLRSDRAGALHLHPRRAHQPRLTRVHGGDRGADGGRWPHTHGRWRRPLLLRRDDLRRARHALLRVPPAHDLAPLRALPERRLRPSRMGGPHLPPRRHLELRDPLRGAHRTPLRKRASADRCGDLGNGPWALHPAPRGHD